MNKVLILGASGYVGARIKQDLEDSGLIVQGTYSSNKLSNDLIPLNITDKNDVSKVIDKVRPDIIIHSANNHSSKWCEENKEMAYQLNTVSTGFIVDETNKYNIKLIYISTMGAIDPTNFYQNTKSDSETIIKTQCKTDFAILRPSIGIGISPNKTTENLYNTALKKYLNGEVITADTSLKFQPTYLGHISQVIKQLIDKELWNKTIPISTEVEKSKYDVLNDIFGKLGGKVIKEDLNRTPFNSIKDIDRQLKEFGLPTLDYSQLVDKCVSEISKPK